MFKRTVIATSVALAITALPAVAQEEEGSFLDEWEIAGELKNESAVFTKDGTTIGADSATLNTTWTNDPKPHDKSDLMKSETSIRLFINGPVGESSELHAELRPVRDSQTVDGYKGHENYTQQDFLRELYVDTATGEDDDVSLRIGKQQVVWGTADGMKLLDIINPTDYREMAQNTMDESRIPVWMLNAETDLEDGSNVQFIVSQPRENVFAGLDRNINTSVRGNNTSTFADETSDAHGQGHAFIMQGVDSMTGFKNGFLNIVPDLGGVARRFAWGFGGISELSAATMAGFTVTGFEAMTMDVMAGAMQSNGMLCATNGNCSVSETVTNGNYDSGTITYLDLPDNFENAIEGVATNLGVSAGSVTGQQMLQHGFGVYYNTNLADDGTDNYADTTFDHMQNTTFRTFDAFVNAKSQWVYNMPSDSDVDLAVRYKNSTEDGVNYSLNASYNYDKNPIVNMSWRDDSGNLLYVINSSNTLTLNSASDGSGTAYGGLAGNAPTMRFEQTVKRAKNIGGSFDMAIETEGLGPVVIRGEALYQKDIYSPVMDKSKLDIGNLPAALEMVKGDKFKYVLGADITALTNMMVSAQLIQERDLDFIDGDQLTGRYTADYATMNLLNGLNKATKNKEFYSLFFSKPFGGEQQHRWNNIFMYEENGGKWNRFDVEYSFSDELIGTFEYDKYWGDANTQFGQLEASSNAQLGLKYIF